MSQVKIKVRPNQTVNFPGICVHCGQAAAEMMEVRKRQSRISRRIEVPVCTTCAGQLQKMSMEEERLGKLKYIIAGAALVVVLLAIYLVLPPSLPGSLRWLMAVGAAFLVTAVIFTFVQHKAQETYLPEKQAVLNAARITEFSWRATTFEFENDTFSQRFIEINEPLLME